LTRLEDIEAFMKWIENELNPERKHNGLCPIEKEEQVRCYEILERFQDKMRHEDMLEGRGGWNLKGTAYFTRAELKQIYENDNLVGDCDCSLCRDYREILKEAKDEEEKIES